METWLSDVNDFVSDEADDMSYSVRIAALNLIMVSMLCCYGYLCHVTIFILDLLIIKAVCFEMSKFIITSLLKWLILPLL